MRYLSGATSGTIVAGGNGYGQGNTQLMGPIGVAFDPTTNSLLIANSDAHRFIRWIIGDTNWTLIAGSSSGVLGSTSNFLCNPTNVKLDSMNNMYVADRSNQRIVFIPYGQTSYTTIAGVPGISGTSSNLFMYPSCVVIDSQLNIYIADNSNARI